MPTKNSILPSMRVDTQVAVVTGAGRGIGRGAALALADAGAEIIALSRTQAELSSLATEITEAGGRAQTIVCDVTDTVQMREVFAEIEHIDILVNNAGTNAPGPFLDMEDATLDLILNLNVRAACLVAREGARRMADQGSGVIINLSSTFGKVGRPGNAVYSASKHFIEGLTKSLAVELAPRQVRVVAVGPTAIVTPMTAERLADPASGGDLRARIPLGRFGEVEDVVGAVVFLASPAAALITGVTLMVDGGWTAQ